MKTFLGFTLGVLVGVYGFTILLITTPRGDTIIRNAKNFCGMD